MKDNRFERLYGYVFRSLAKSILEEFVKGKDDEYLTIGILQYKPYDESFYYSPTLKNCLLLPEEIDYSYFPTQKNCLWDYDLMKYLGVYLSQSKAQHWVHELFLESRAISRENVSTYSITYDGYDSFISIWEQWYNNFIRLNVNILSDHETLESKKLLNQIFYFGSYLLTITRQIAFGGGNNNRTYAAGMYLCISNPQLLTDSDIFDKRTGYLIRGNNIVWTNQSQTLIHKAELNQVLEICFRWPFGINEKITVIRDLIYKHKNSISSSIHEHILNATAVPLNYHGEFLGICYLSQPSNNSEKNNIADKAQDLNKIVNESKITGILHRSRYATARLALQKINEESFNESTIFRIFNLSHIYSSAPVVALIDDQDNLFIRSRRETESIRKMETKKSVKSGYLLLNFLEKEINNFSINHTPKQLFNWYDIYPSLQPEKCDTELEAYNIINVFNIKFFEFLNPLVSAIPDQYRITSLVYLKIEVDDVFYSLIFFNSNFTLLYDAYITHRLKQSYALEMHNNIKQLIETEQSQRLIFFQNNQFQEDIRKGVIHYIKGFLNLRILPFLKNPVTDEDREQLLNNSNKLASRLKDWLEVYDIVSKTYPINIEELINIWVDITNEYSTKRTTFLFNAEDKLFKNHIKILANKQGLRIIFSEIINNALAEYEAVETTNGAITLSVSSDSRNFLLSISNTQSWISTKYLDVAGFETIQSDHITSTGIGFMRCEDLLHKIGAIKIGGRHFHIANTDNPKGFYFEFKLKGVIQ
ncbi:MAG: ATP-binding protein [Ignavibacteriaceae bacterium]